MGSKNLFWVLNSLVLFSHLPWRIIVDSVIKLVVVHLVDHVLTVVGHDVVVEPVTPQNFIGQVGCSYLSEHRQERTFIFHTLSGINRLEAEEKIEQWFKHLTHGLDAVSQEC